MVQIPDKVMTLEEFLELPETKPASEYVDSLNHGCQMGWLIDPEEQTILIYPLGQQPEVLELARDLLPVPDLAPGLQLTVGDVFGWLKL